MAMKTLYFKEHEGIVHSPIGQLSPVAWWSSAFGSQSVNIGESCNLPTTLSMEPPTRENDQVTVAKHTRLSADQKGMHKWNTTHTIFPGDCKASGDGEKSPQSVISLQPPLPEYGTHFDFGFGQPMIYAAKYPLVDQCYGVFSAYAAQIPGRVMLPMNFSDEGPIYVNAKQYHGIMRRRKSRAKAVDENKMLTRNRKPYMHHSRHLHALRRPRGCGGRFLNSKELNDVKIRAEAKKICDFQLSQPTGSQGSEILQSGSGTSGSGGSLNSRKEVNGGGSNHSGSEVTSVYSRGAMDHFSFDLLCPPPSHSFPGIMDNGHDIVMPSKWVAAAAVAVGCCNHKD